MKNKKQEEALKALANMTDKELSETYKQEKKPKKGKILHGARKR